MYKITQKDLDDAVNEIQIALVQFESLGPLAMTHTVNNNLINAAKVLRNLILSGGPLPLSPVGKELLLTADGLARTGDLLTDLIDKRELANKKGTI